MKNQIETQETETQNDMEEVAQEQQSDQDPWKAFKRQFSGVALLKDARRLRELRSKAQSKKGELQEQKVEKEKVVEQTDDALDRLAITEEIQETQSRIDYCDVKLKAIRKRVETLLEEAESEQVASEASGVNL